MNKNFSLILNIILLIAVGILYYLHFSSKAQAPEMSKSTDSTAAAKPIVLAPKEIKPSKVVYVNMDMLSKEYEYLKDESAAAESQLRALQNQYQTKGQEFQKDYMTFQEKANKGLLSENQIKGEQEKFEARKEDLGQVELKADQIKDRIREVNEKARKNLIDYLQEYNKIGNYSYIFQYSEDPLSPILIANDSLDISKDILEGINAAYRATKKK